MSIRDHLPPEPGSRLAYAYRMMAIEESRERRLELERQAERAAKLQEQHDAAENVAFVTGRQPLTQAELFATVSALGDAEDAAEERQRSACRAEKHKFGEVAEVLSRADRLAVTAANLRSQRDSLRASEDSRLKVDRERAKAEQRVAARYRRGSSYR